MKPKTKKWITHKKAPKPKKYNPIHEEGFRVINWGENLDLDLRRGPGSQRMQYRKPQGFGKSSC